MRVRAKIEREYVSNASRTNVLLVAFDSADSLLSYEVSMSWLENALAFTSTVAGEEDRRSDERTKVLKPVLIRHLNSSPEDEVAGTLVDLSRDGLCFTVRSDEYRVGMELHLTFPDAGSECSCEVVRTERLLNGRIGIGARIIGW